MSRVWPKWYLYVKDGKPVFAEVEPQGVENVWAIEPFDARPPEQVWFNGELVARTFEEDEA